MFFYVISYNIFYFFLFHIFNVKTLFVDLGGVEPPSEQLILRHAKILVVNVLMISQNIRFKAILSHSDAFSLLLWVANPLKL